MKFEDSIVAVMNRGTWRRLEEETKVYVYI